MYREILCGVVNELYLDLSANFVAGRVAMRNGACGLLRLCLLLLIAFWFAGCGQPGDDARVPVESVQILNAGTALEVDQTRRLHVCVMPVEASGFQLIPELSAPLEFPVPLLWKI